MNTLQSPPTRVTWRCGHAPDGIASVRSGSRRDQRHPNEGTPSSARSEQSSCLGQSGPRRAGSANHGSAWHRARRGVACAGGVSAGQIGSCGGRPCAIMPATPVRHGCRSPWPSTARRSRTTRTCSTAPPIRRSPRDYCAANSSTTLRGASSLKKRRWLRAVWSAKDALRGKSANSYVASAASVSPG